MFDEEHLVNGEWMYTAGHGSTAALFTTHPFVALWFQSNSELKQVEWQIKRRRFRVTRQKAVRRKEAQTDG
jgi:hypothetical protein